MPIPTTAPPQRHHELFCGTQATALPGHPEVDLSESDGTAASQRRGCGAHRAARCREQRLCGAGDYVEPRDVPLLVMVAVSRVVSRIAGCELHITFRCSQVFEPLDDVLVDVPAG